LLGFLQPDIRLLSCFPEPTYFHHSLPRGGWKNLINSLSLPDEFINPPQTENGENWEGKKGRESLCSLPLGLKALRQVAFGVGGFN